VNQLTTPRLLIGVAAFISFLFSIGLWFAGYQDQGMFVGLWVPSILALGAFIHVSSPRPLSSQGGVA
jgi:hypothetical protein